MQFEFTPMTWRYAETIAHWRYSGIYAFYNLEQDPEDREEFLDPTGWKDTYYAVLDESEALVGFFVFEREDEAIVLGLGLSPDLTSRGLGAGFVEEGLQFARRTFKPMAFRLSVAVFNQRAIRVYERLGFITERVFQQETNGGTYEFVEMRRVA